MKILHVGESVLGGAGTYINELSPLQVRLLGQDNVAVLIPDEHKHHISSPALKNIFTFLRPNRKAGLLHLLCAYIQAVRSFRPDLIHAHSTFSGLISRLLYPFFRTPIVYCPHGWAVDMEQSDIKVNVITAIEYVLSFMCQKIIAISDYERKRGIQMGIAQDKIVTVHNGVCKEPPEFKPVFWDDARLKVLFVGRLDRQKGIDVLLNALTGLQEKACARIIGASVAGDSSVDFSPFLNIEALGWKNMSEITAQMAVCDVVVMPSRWEGFGLVAIEAMRLSKPVIASSIGGLPEVVADGVTGLLFPPTDSDALRHLILSVDPERLKQMGQAGRERFLSHFTSDRMCEKIFEVYKTCLQKNKGAAL